MVGTVFRYKKGFQKLDILVKIPSPQGLLKLSSCRACFSSIHFLVAALVWIIQLGRLYLLCLTWTCGECIKLCMS